MKYTNKKGREKRGKKRYSIKLNVGGWTEKPELQNLGQSITSHQGQYLEEEKGVPGSKRQLNDLLLGAVLPAKYKPQEKGKMVTGRERRDLY